MMALLFGEDVSCTDESLINILSYLGYHCKNKVLRKTENITLQKIGWIHHKNENALLKACEKFNINYESYNDVPKKYEKLIISSDRYTPAKQGIKILHGPHFFIYNDTLANNENVTFNCLSNWVKNLCIEYNTKCNLVTLPFGVDVDRFFPDDIEKDIVLIYYKKRNPEILSMVIDEIVKTKLKYEIIKYGEYDENKYIKTLNSSKYCIWVGCHESQGFALQECLSMNVPMIVLDVTSMKDEFGNKYNDDKKMHATSAPYWDEQCGIIIHNINQLKDAINAIDSTKFASRNFILKNLTIDNCFINMLYTMINLDL